MIKIKPEIAELLNYKCQQYKNKNFISQDPISIPHLFQNKKDIEIAGFLTALISWGNRKSIIQSAMYLMQLMKFQPYQFVMNYTPSDNKKLSTFYYRTFQYSDLIFFIRALKKFYLKHESIENVFIDNSILDGISYLREELLSVRHLKRSEKHLPDIKKGSAAKRINMFLRWMVRKDEIDFGIWKKVHPSNLLIPLDIHTAKTAYTLELLPNTKSSIKNVLHLTDLLKTMDDEDPIKYDFALFGLSIYEKIDKSKIKTSDYLCVKNSICRGL